MQPDESCLSGGTARQLLDTLALLTHKPAVGGEASPPRSPPQIQPDTQHDRRVSLTSVDDHLKMAVPPVSTSLFSDGPASRN